MDIQKVEQKIVHFLQTVEKDAIMAWDAFLDGVTYLKHEATVVSKLLANADPAIAKQWQKFINDAEASAGELLARSEGGMNNLIVAGVDRAEQIAANTIQSALGNKANPTESALLTSGLQFLGTTLEHMTTVGYAKAVSALLSAASVPQITKSPDPPPPQVMAPIAPHVLGNW